MATANVQQPSSQQGNRSKAGEGSMQTNSGFEGIKEAVKSGAQTLQHGAERAMEGASEYGTQLNEEYVKPFERAVTRFVKNRPVTSILIGSSIGFLAARLMHRSKRSVQ